ncbi:GNAT family N-acetyltransferase [Alkalicoccus halolimnae]|uniref:GNAT family N-acetyltransferase n=1 Tax=Alkalicoccus halolimnae TaxID=1667239 RepID=A0A5C7F5Y3_9BACI|nr:GNAT family N-acetyltransferase [Alkalicoccus halolimnae]TXF84671.1 GNAT family N-acetyltransferase [Alkalicoccus halolimnae]
MNINKNHVSLLARAFEKDPMFEYLFSNKNNKDQSKTLIKFIIKRNHLSDGMILTDHTKNPGYVAVLERPENLARVSVGAKVRLNIKMLLLVFQLPFHVLRFLTKYQKQTVASAPNAPHYYITMIGVEPSFQGRGLGKKVLKEIHELAASSQPPSPIALDTENDQNIAYYEKLGYELKDTKVIDGLKVYCMTRPAEQSK